MKSITCLTVALACITIGSIARGAVGDDAGKVGQMNNAFATDLYAQLAGKSGNLFFSPTSLQTALAMTMAGARGKTADEMARTLHLDNDPTSHEELGHFLQKLNADGKQGGYELAVANALWGARDYAFSPDYLALVERDYAGHLNGLDFAHDPEGSRKIINDWVTHETRDKIHDLIPNGSILPDTRLVLTNAIYFKGKWAEPFNKKQTQEADFTAAGGRKMKASLMYQQKHFRYAEDADLQALELPYVNNDLAMWVFLPTIADGLPALEKGLTAERIARLGGEFSREEVKVWMPRFRMESEFSLADKLKAMGMKLAFDPNGADFSGMSSAERLCISAVVHKAFVNVDEEGTEAAAASGIIMRPTAAFRPTVPKVFRADHPFVFAIVHQQTQAMLFMGRVEAP